jgi:hypothetical protein
MDLPLYPVMCQHKRDIMRMMSQLKKSEAGAPVEKFAEAIENLEYEAEIFKKIEPMVVAVQLKHLASGDEINDVDSFFSHPACNEIISELCLKLMTGFAEKN